MLGHRGVLRTHRWHWGRVSRGGKGGCEQLFGSSISFFSSFLGNCFNPLLRLIFLSSLVCMVNIIKARKVTFRAWVKCLSGIWFLIPGREHLLAWLEWGDCHWSNQPWPRGQGHRGEIWLPEAHSLTEKSFQVLGRYPRSILSPTKYKVLNYSVTTESLQWDRCWAKHISSKSQQTNELDGIIVTLNPHNYPLKWVLLFYPFYRQGS